MLKTDFNAGWLCRETPGGKPFEVTLPHDQSIHKPRSAAEKSGSAGGYFPAVDLEYTKDFALPEDAKRAFVYFDGAYQNAEVYVDGVPAAREPHGYVPFVAPVDTSGSDKTHKLRVTLASGAAPNSRWYAGSGIYREVSLLTGGEICFDPRGAMLKPVADGENSYIACSAALLGAKGQALKAKLSIFDKGGKLAASGVFDCGEGELNCTLPLPNPRLWSPDDAYLYSYTLTLTRDGTEEDAVSGRLGFRSVKLDREKGLLLNGKAIKLRGGCVHHDNGILGAAAYPDAEKRKARLLKQNGFNAVRTAHNPPSSAFLDACDEEGLIVLNEFTDMWNWGKNPYDYHLWFGAWWKSDLLSMIRQDHNHPSVLLRSIGNEIPERDGSLNGYAIAREMCDFIRSVDPTRLLVSALNNISPKRAQMLEANLSRDSEKDWFDLLSRETFAPLDAAGYNYMFRRYEKDLEKYPERFIIGTESVAQEVRENERAVQASSRVLGDFIWSAVDYLGEAGIGAIHDSGATGYFEGFPWRLAHCGDLDICGVKRPQSYLRDAVWGRLDRPYVAVQPPWRYESEGQVSYWSYPERYSCWDFAGHEGRPLRVFVYTDAPRVTLYLNGREIASAKACDFVAAFELAYKSGTLEAVDSMGRVSRLSTPGKEAKLTLTSDTAAFTRKGQLAFIDICLGDEGGNLRVFDERTVKVSSSGARLLALGTASPTDLTGFDASEVRLYRARALAVLACEGKDAVFAAEGEGIIGARVTIPFEPDRKAED
ncbi:MAG: DUF4982 domain-containing protein [Clostridia bacterium]|nr:DUF4982 domain-containing protein [Clostridia bacterium]